MGQGNGGGAGGAGQGGYKSCILCALCLPAPQNPASCACHPELLFPLLGHASPSPRRWLASLLAVFVSNRAKVKDGYYLWENIFPQAHDGRPCISPTGKYAVRLFIQVPQTCWWVGETPHTPSHVPPSHTLPQAPRIDPAHACRGSGGQ